MKLKGGQQNNGAECKCLKSKEAMEEIAIDPGNKGGFCSFAQSKAQKITRKTLLFIKVKKKKTNLQGFFLFTKAPFLSSHITFSCNQILVSLSGEAGVH